MNSSGVHPDPGKELGMAPDAASRVMGQPSRSGLHSSSLRHITGILPQSLCRKLVSDKYIDDT